MIRVIPSVDLKDGMTLALPFQGRAVVNEVRVGRKFVNFKFDDNMRSRVATYDSVIIEICPHDEVTTGYCGEVTCENYYMKQDS